MAVLDFKTCIYLAVFLMFINQICLVVSEDDSLIYACYPNGTLKIQNPGGYQGVFANNSNVICNTTFMNDKLFLFVTECPFDVAISVTFSNYSGIHTGVLGGRKAVEAFLITCNQIPASGTFRELTNGLGVTYLSTNLSSIYPDYPIISNITEYGYGIGQYFPVYSASVNDKLAWFIYITEETSDDVLLRPELCTAYAGLNVTNSTSSKNITSLGCTLDEKLTGNFHYNYTYSSLLADMFAFRFIESEYITIECDVRICPNTSTACDISCGGGRRRRQDLNTDPLLDDSYRLFKSLTTIRVEFNSCNRGCCSFWVNMLSLVLAFLTRSYVIRVYNNIN